MTARQRRVLHPDLRGRPTAIPSGLLFCRHRLCYSGGAMPELPEVETIARQLAPQLEGRRIGYVQILDPKLVLNPEDIAGSVIARVLRFGKRLILELRGSDKRNRYLRFDLRMTGRLTWSPSGETFSQKHLRAVFGLDDGNLLFYDLRRLGTIRIYDNLEDARPAGIEPLDPNLTSKRLKKILSKSRQALKVWLLRQDRLAGIGNIYASEICFAAGLNPLHPVNDLNYREVRSLLHAVRSVLREAVENRGTTLSDYRDARGDKGGHQFFLNVYRRENEPCPRCGGRIRRIVLQQRSTFYCPGCQV